MATDRKEYMRLYRLKNKERIYEVNKKYRLDHAKEFSEYNKTYNSKPENKAAKDIYSAKHRSDNPEMYRARYARYRAERLQRTPSWLTEEELVLISNLYKQAIELELLTGIKFHIDHILPLKGKEVSGLHIFDNLQILEATENLRKGIKCKA